MKLVVAEPESSALWRELEGHTVLVASALAIAEVERAVTRWGAANGLDAGALRRHTAGILEALTLLDVDLPIIEAAAAQPGGLGVLNAIHLVSAQALGPDLAALVTYDEGLAAAAGGAGVRVLSPR